MSAVVLRCPHCGTVQDVPGECDACHESPVRYYCANHAPGRWLDGPACADCGARVGVDPAGPARRPPATPPATPPTAAPRPRPAPLPPAPPDEVERVEVLDLPPRRTRRGGTVTLGELFGPDGPFGPRGPFGRGRVPGGLTGAPGDFDDAAPSRRGPALRTPAIRVPGLFGCVGRVLMLVVFLILALLAGSFVWVANF